MDVGFPSAPYQNAYFNVQVLCERVHVYINWVGTGSYWLDGGQRETRSDTFSYISYGIEPAELRGVFFMHSAVISVACSCKLIQE